MKRTVAEPDWADIRVRYGVMSVGHEWLTGYARSLGLPYQGVADRVRAAGIKIAQFGNLDIEKGVPAQQAEEALVKGRPRKAKASKA